MKVDVACPVGHRFRCDEQHLGRRVKCPRSGCGERFVLAQLAQSPIRCRACNAALPDHQCIICNQCGINQITGERAETQVIETSDRAQIPRYVEIIYAHRLGKLDKEKRDDELKPHEAIIAIVVFALLAFVPIASFKPGFVPDTVWSIIAVAWMPIFLLMSFLLLAGLLASFIPDSTRATQEVAADTSARPTVSDRIMALGAKFEAAVDNTSDAPPPIEDILLELDRRNNRKPHLWSFVIIAALSIAAFVALGLRDISPAFMVLLVIVILMHEAGHLAAMRMFGYSHLRMLFIPMLGAVASGRKVHTSAWQQVVVSLAGPVPGMLIGFILGFIYLLEPSNWLGLTSLMFVLLNGLNLAPLFPLDGGHIMNDLIFWRHRVLEALFRALTSIGLLILAVLMSSWVVAFFALFMLLGALFAYQSRTRAEEVRRRNPDVCDDQSENVPPDAVIEILSVICEQKRPPKDAKLIAAEIDEVWKRLHARPPNSAATVLLLSVYFLTVASMVAYVAIVLAMLIHGTLPAPESGPIAEFIRGFHDGMRSGSGP